MMCSCLHLPQVPRDVGQVRPHQPLPDAQQLLPADERFLPAGRRAAQLSSGRAETVAAVQPGDGGAGPGAQEDREEGGLGLREGRGQGEEETRGL